MPNQITFRLVRTVAVGSLPDADPRATPPDPVGVAVDQSTPGETSSQLPYGSSHMQPQGHSFYVRFTNGAVPASSPEVVGPTVTVQPWAYDPGATRWASGAAEEDVGSSEIFDSSLIGTLFHQLTALANTGAATHVHLYVVDRLAI